MSPVVVICTVWLVTTVALVWFGVWIRTRGLTLRQWAAARCAPLRAWRGRWNDLDDAWMQAEAEQNADQIAEYRRWRQNQRRRPS